MHNRVNPFAGNINRKKHSRQRHRCDRGLNIKSDREAKISSKSSQEGNFSNRRCNSEAEQSDRRQSCSVRRSSYKFDSRSGNSHCHSQRFRRGGW